MDSPECLASFDVWETEEENENYQRVRGPQEARGPDGAERSSGRIWRRRLRKATVRDDVREVKRLLERAGAWRDADLLSGILLATSEEMVRVFLESAPGFLGRDALLRAAEGGHEGALRALLAAGWEADDPAPGSSLRPLHAACLHGHAACARLLLEHGADPSGKTAGDLTPLHYAAASNSLGCAEVLLEQGADALAEAENGRQPLHLAANWGSAAIVRTLVKHGADPNNRDQQENPPIIYAARGDENMSLPLYPYKKILQRDQSDQLDCFKTLIELGADMSVTGESPYNPFFEAIGWKQTGIVQYLVDGKVDLLERTLQGETALNYAAGYANTEAVCILVAAGMDINSRRNDGRTPLLTAIETAGPTTLECIKELINLGADVHLVDNEGWSALHIAAFVGKVELVRHLLDLGCSITLTTVDGCTPLHLASGNYDVDVLTTLLENGADFHARTTNGKTLVHFAAESWSSSCLEVLLRRGADLYARDDRGWTALHYAANYGAVAVINFLLSQGFDKGARTNNGQTALHICAQTDDGYCMGMLLRLKAPVNARDAAGRTPLHEAARTADDLMAQTLLLNGASCTVRDNEGNTPGDLAITLDIQRLIRRWAIAA